MTDYSRNNTIMEAYARMRKGPIGPSTYKSYRDLLIKAYDAIHDLLDMAETYGEAMIGQCGCDIRDLSVHLRDPLYRINNARINAINFLDNVKRR